MRKSKNTVSIPTSLYFEMLLISQDLLSGESVNITDIAHINSSLLKALGNVKTLSGLAERTAEAI